MSCFIAIVNNKNCLRHQRNLPLLLNCGFVCGNDFELENVLKKKNI